MKSFAIIRGCCFFGLLGLPWAPVRAEVDPVSATLFLDFAKDESNVKLFHGAKRVQGRFGGALEFTTALQYAEVALSRTLDGIQAMTVGGWFFPRRSGEQYFFFRGIPESGPLGERFFRPTNDWVNFVLGTDQRGFLLGTINGNGSMPFAHVTVNEVAFDAWNQLAVVKDARGFQKFYVNGTLVHADEHAATAGKIWPFRDTSPGEPVRLAMPLGGRIGEAWIYPREVSADEIEKDFLTKRDRYHPALPGRPVRLREMNAHPSAGLWKVPPGADTWPSERQRILDGARQILGSFPKAKAPLDPKMISEEDCGTYLRRKVSIQAQADDRMPAYLLIPKRKPGRVPAIICFYGTTSGAGKETTVGLSGRAPNTPSQRNHAFAIDMAEAGFVAFAADYLRDGERIKPGRRPYDTTDFYQQFPDWSIHGKDIWDTSRAIDYLQTLDFVDPEKIGMTGHSYGGHSTLFTTALEPRIKVAVANGPVSDFLHHGMHWGVPKGGGNSQSMPALRPFVRDHTLPLPVTFYEFTALIAPRPLLVGEAAGERRPMEEENYAAVREVYRALGHANRVRYHWYAGDHDYPPEARQAAVEWFKRWFADDTSAR
ncbi:MAG: acetylxylan esterase [Verrucomicrobia bacterium]|nr:acetylxylan esterase [Verrucomicrobiota bacterium]